MPLRIDISDAAIEKTEAIHQLHVWGVKVSQWKNNCIVELAVINPALEDNVLLKKLGHGLAIGPGHKALWPGPVIFFSYGYDISDYVKVGPNQPVAGVSGAEADMTQHEIWRELDTLR
ncbi:hypothetical protein VTH06DRAFT_5914 [Thermothelomyces fergusii]